MAFRRGRIVVFDSIAAAARGVAAALVCALMIAGTPVVAQDASKSSTTVPHQAAPPDTSPAVDRPGFIDALGRWFGTSQQAIDPGLKSTQDTLGTLGGKAAGAARDAAATIVAIPGTRIVTGRQVCPISSNGAPDCQTGVQSLCRDKGLQGGKVLEIASGQRCSPKAWVESGFKQRSLCRTETYVTRAVCQ